MKIINLDQIKNISIDNLIELYRDGYRLEEHTPIASLSNFHTSNFSNFHTLQGSLLDPVVNFGKVIVSSCTGGCTATATEVTVDNGAKFPDPATGAFNLVWWNSTDYIDPSDDPNIEIVRCTAKSGNVLTIERAQEGTLVSTKNSSGKVYKMILSPTAKMISDISSAITARVVTTTADVTYAPIAKGVTNGDSHDHNGGDGAQIDHVNLANKGINTHTQIDSHISALAPHSGYLTDILAGLSPVAAGWTVSPSPLGELTDANYTAFATPGYTTWAAYEGSKTMTLTWDFGELKPVTLIVWSGQFEKSITSVPSYNVYVEVWDESSTWVTLDTFAYPGGGIRDQIKLLNPYTQISKIRIRILFDNGGVGAGTTITLRGRRLCAYM